MRAATVWVPGVTMGFNCLVGLSGFESRDPGIDCIVVVGVVFEMALASVILSKDTDEIVVISSLGS